MSDNKPDESDDSTFRETLSNAGFKPDADGIKWGPAKPKVLVAGAYKVIRTAAERARSALSREK